MQPRPLGTSGILVSPIGLGTVKFGRTAGLKYPGAFELPSDDSVVRLLGAAVELGVRLIDTAPAYGSSEERLGKLLSRAAPRDQWVICSKAGEEFDPETGSRFDFTPEAIRASILRSLKRLRTDRLDIALVHSDGRDEWIIGCSGALDALKQLKGEGLIRAVGVSTKTARGALLAARECDVVMLTLNHRDREDLPAVSEALGLGCGVLVKKALMSGHAQVPAQSLAFVLGTPGVSSAIVGTLSAEHLAANVRAAASSDR